MFLRGCGPWGHSAAPPALRSPLTQCPGQILTIPAVAHKGEHASLIFSLRSKKLYAIHTGKRLLYPRQQSALVGQNAVLTGPTHKADTLQQPGNASHIMSSRLAPIRQVERHLLPNRFTSRPTGQKRV